MGDLTVRENIILAMQSNRGWFKHFSAAKQREIADRYIKLLNISTPTADQLAKNLSGGNQQKVILARWLATDPAILILDEPTRGIDIGAKAEIQKLVLTLAGERNVEKETKDETCHRVERSYGTFSRSFTLPTNLKTDKVEAKFDKGVLTIVVLSLIHISEPTRPY